VTDDPIKDVSDTAFMIAIYRAFESERPDALFRDPLARRLAGEHGVKIAASLSRVRAFREWMVVVRTRIIDDFIYAAVAQGVDTVLNLGAGLDTRPYRMDLPGSLRWIEVDYPHVIEWKEAHLLEEQPRCRLERFKVDLADVPARRSLLADIAAASRQTLVLTEGVIPYLETQQVAMLAEDLRALSAFRYWIADYFSADVYRHRRREEARGIMANAPFRFEANDYFGFFREHGWRSQQIRYLAAAGEQLNRPLPLPKLVKLFFMLSAVFMSSERKQAAREFAGYVLFEPDA
jgi:methyltransferase (TIGR00027 family)